MKTHSPSLSLWRNMLGVFLLLGLAQCYQTGAEYCEYCEDPYPTEIISFTYSPATVMVGDTVTFTVQITDSLDRDIQYFWQSDDGTGKQVGSFIGGVISDLFERRDRYETPGPTIQWVAADTARVYVILANYKETPREKSTSELMNPLPKEQ